jgi:hypothetical protein
MAKSIDPAAFWADYSARFGETVLAHGLGRYVGGAEVPGPLWGLIVASDAGFRFYHFPNEGLIFGLARTMGQAVDPPSEKTFFIARADLVRAELIDPPLWRRWLLGEQPTLALRYRAADGSERMAAIETDPAARNVAAALAAAT